MTKQETRQLGIEFERRLQIMYPNSKYTEKLTTDTIYSILNEYQIKYIKLLYIVQRQQNLGELGAESVDNALQSLCCTETVNVARSQSGNVDTFTIPPGYWLYVRSTSNGEVNYKLPKNTEVVEDAEVIEDNDAVEDAEVVEDQNTENDEAQNKSVLSNMLIESKDVNSVINKYHNYAGIIRHPLVALQENKFMLIRDLYTTINTVDLTYYRMPNKFGVYKSTQYNSEDYLQFDFIDGSLQIIDAGWETPVPEKIIYHPLRKLFIAKYQNECFEDWEGTDKNKYTHPEEGQLFLCNDTGTMYIWENGDLYEHHNIDFVECELPISAFDDLVSGALKLYVFEYKFALALSASNSKYNKLKKGVDKLAEDNKQE